MFSAASSITCYSQCILMLLMTGEQHIRVQVFTGKLLPWRCQVFLLVHSFYLHIEYHMKQLGILLRRVTGIKFWSERKNKVCGKENLLVRGRKRLHNCLHTETHDINQIISICEFYIKDCSYLLNFNMVVPGAIKPVWN